LATLLILDPFGNGFPEEPLGNPLGNFSQALQKYLLMWFYYDRPPQKFSGNLLTTPSEIFVNRYTFLLPASEI
jgi:hypothetical protein